MVSVYEIKQLVAEQKDIGEKENAMLHI